eukprot:6213453-Pleurochrysis_carterae.AAC.5
MKACGGLHACARFVRTASQENACTWTYRRMHVCVMRAKWCEDVSVRVRLLACMNMSLSYPAYLCASTLSCVYATVGVYWHA